ncbi:MAG TPA: branched-chain amino acid ABC transporter permease [Cellulomonas sp.]
MSTLPALLQITASSLATGALYALLLFGILVVYRVSKAVNFAHGALGMVAAVVTYSLVQSAGAAVLVAAAAAVLVATIASFLTDRLVLEPITRRTGRQGLDLVVTLGLLLLITAVVEALFGTTSKSFLPLGTDIPVELGQVYLNANQVVFTIVAVVFVVAVVWLIEKTSLGLSMRATATDPELAASMGLDVKRVRALTWGFAGAVVGVVGIVTASRQSVDAYFMQPFLIKAVIAGMIGGLDRYVAPLAAAFGLALFEGFVVYTLGTSYTTPAVFGLVIVLLAVLPQRFLTEKGVVRA